MHQSIRASGLQYYPSSDLTASFQPFNVTKKMCQSSQDHFSLLEGVVRDETRVF